MRFLLRHEGGLQLWAWKRMLYAAERADVFHEADVRLPAGRITLLLKNWVCGWKPYSANEFGYFLRVQSAGSEEPPAGLRVSP